MFHHITVLKEEAVAGLNIKPNGIYIDCTLGGAGHSELIASQLSEEGLLIGLDQDETALAHAQQKLQPYKEKVKLIKTNFSALEQVLLELPYIPKQNGVPQVDGCLFDLGVSSPQLDEAERGFSYQHDASLDMRMDRSQSLSAYDIVNNWSEKELANIIFKYGEEKFSRKIARQIISHREQQAIETTLQLVDIIKNSIPAAARRTGPHPAKRTFQALRIAVNDELGVFESAIEQAITCLAPGGRISVITFHSLEDRICKQSIAKFVERCTCPPDFPVCTCQKNAVLKHIKRKPILPSEQELTDNPRARSAKLRVAEKI
ncbi:16S rRNA (cytosine(1402)-N(4))-methyltransferase RsmH [Longirhabdus pacifica]|uniref:16S rRNA (cytosine(1402)-N(4))-methyltransferase RsmH n=1 Tax=Longirhabdus pacifica TaxID=2305227 RepID=UPI001008D245|nr:16S rRNA (cytosine(1402)-N(4))-methyltransferase RsmH [Longirhabdus pacifica]